MVTATITSKGQVTIPKVIRDKLHLDAGQRIEFLMDSNGKVTICPVVESVKKLKGMVRKPKNAVSLDDMKAAIREQGGRNR